MRRDIRHAVAVFVAIATVSLAENALATSQRTFVASTGLDANACSLTAPCRSFAAAITQSSAKGEVIVLDSAGYGPVTITKSVSLIAPAGIYAGVTVFSGDGITVDAPGIIVVLRGLSINGQGGANGINLLQAARLRIENCVISGMVSSGILHTADGAELVVLDTIIRDNLGTGLFILADTSVVLDHVRSEHNQIDGFVMLSLNSGVSATIGDSLFAFNGRNGILVQASVTTSNPNVLVDRSVLADNGAAGFVLDGRGAAYSFGTLTRNAIHRNGGDGAGILSGGSAFVYVTMSENAIGGNSAEGIRADGQGVYLLASANTLSRDSTFTQANSAFFGSYRNNVGAPGVIGTISTLTGI